MLPIITSKATTATPPKIDLLERCTRIIVKEKNQTDQTFSSKRRRNKKRSKKDLKKK
eukprot:m.33266 g.33266  ORF g.33266 m.33266 type:complete len:57 (-) comp6438_c0_seq4:112-282(-)